MFRAPPPPPPLLKIECSATYKKGTILGSGRFIRGWGSFGGKWMSGDFKILNKNQYDFEV